MREAGGVLLDPALPGDPAKGDWDWAASEQADWEAAVDAQAAVGAWPVGDAVEGD